MVLLPGPQLCPPSHFCAEHLPCHGFSHGHFGPQPPLSPASGWSQLGRHGFRSKVLARSVNTCIGIDHSLSCRVKTCGKNLIHFNFCSYPCQTEPVTPAMPRSNFYFQWKTFLLRSPKLGMSERPSRGRSDSFRLSFLARFTNPRRNSKFTWNFRKLLSFSDLCTENLTFCLSTLRESLIDLVTMQMIRSTFIQEGGNIITHIDMIWFNFWLSSIFVGKD